MDKFGRNHFKFRLLALLYLVSSSVASPTAESGDIHGKFSSYSPENDDDNEKFNQDALNEGRNSEANYFGQNGDSENFPVIIVPIEEPPPKHISRKYLCEVLQLCTGAPQNSIMPATYINEGRILKRVRRDDDADADDGDDDDDDGGQSGHPEATPQPHQAESHLLARQKSDNGQYQSQESGSASGDQMNYNPDGSVKSHRLDSASSNKQSQGQNHKKESTLPLSKAVDPESIVGDVQDKDGHRRGFMDQRPLGALPPMIPMKQASAKFHHRRRKGKKHKSKKKKVVPADDAGGEDKSGGGDGGDGGGGEAGGNEGKADEAAGGDGGGGDGGGGGGGGGEGGGGEGGGDDAGGGEGQGGRLG